MAEHDGSFLSVDSVEYNRELSVSGIEEPAQTFTTNENNSGKKRHNPLTYHVRDIKRRSTSLFDTHISDQLLADENCLSELGVTGIIKLDSIQETNTDCIFPTPSPTTCHLSLLDSKCNPTNGYQDKNVRSSHAKVTKNRAITIFDSPEEGKRGWSELGLRIRKPNKSRGNESQASYDGHFMFVADEVILSIFQKMPKRILVKCARVCKRWRRIAYDESLWRRLDFGGRILKGGVLGNTILDRGVEFLRLASAEIGDFTLGKKCFTQFHKLQYLDLTMASISQNALSQLLSRCKQLRKLSIENLAINDDICRLIAQNVFLTTLNCAMVSGLTCKGLEKIFNSCPLLDELNIGWIKLSHSDVGLVISKLPPNLARLNFSGCREFMDDHNLDRLVSRCNQLRELDVSDSLGLTEQSVYSIVRELKYLNTLHLSRCYYISPSSYSVLRELPHFKALSVYSMLPEEHLSKIRRNLISASVNSELFSTISRPTVGMFRTSIWGHRVRDFAV